MTAGGISYWWYFGTKPVFPAVIELIGPKHIRVISLTIQDHVTSSNLWPYDPLVTICYMCSIAPVVEIMGTKHIGVMTTFWGCVTSSVLTIWLDVGRFLLVVPWNQACISIGFQDIWPQNLCTHRHTLNHYCACAISRELLIKI